MHNTISVYLPVTRLPVARLLAVRLPVDRLLAVRLLAVRLLAVRLLAVRLLAVRLCDFTVCRKIFVLEGLNMYLYSILYRIIICYRHKIIWLRILFADNQRFMRFM